MTAEIIRVKAREILDSRGYPSLEVDVILSNGVVGRSSVPSGASTGKHEALELRDGDSRRFFGKGLLQAIGHVEGELADVVCGQVVTEQRRIDKLMCDLDGSTQKRRLGANSILGVSMAVADAAANTLSLPLFRYLGGMHALRLPVPMVNIINGGAHADNKVDVQEFMILPLGFQTFHDAIRACAEIFTCLRELLKQRNYSVNVGDEGGFAPDLRSNREALDFMSAAIDKAGYQIGEDIFLAMDVAASELMEDDRYHIKSEGKHLDSMEMVAYLANLVRDYPILSVEDGMGEDDKEGWQVLTREIGQDTALIGDDAFVTSTARLSTGIADSLGNGILIKPNQVGTLSETMDAIDMAKDANYLTVMSHRSGETENVHIADYAVGFGCNGIKVGSVARSERLAKYNRLIRIEEMLGPEVRYGGSTWLQKYIASEGIRGVSPG